MDKKGTFKLDDLMFFYSFIYSHELLAKIIKIINMTTSGTCSGHLTLTSAINSLILLIMFYKLII